jgi:ABC-type antimicrobial peptide transport system permease subunit
VVAAFGLAANLYLMVSQRTREFGIRQALGASRSVILKGVLVRGLAIADAGVAAGLGAAGPIERWIRPLAPGTPERDPWPFAVSLAILLVVALGAILGPAFRAAAIDPWTALRHTE